MNITFPAVEAWDGTRGVATFPADVDGKRIRCGVSWEALQDNFNGNNVAPLDCFRANRARIEAKVEVLIRKGRLEQDGSVLLRSQDGA
jgi:hypothetical protein